MAIGGHVGSVGQTELSATQFPAAQSTGLLVGQPPAAGHRLTLLWHEPSEHFGGLNKNSERQTNNKSCPTLIGKAPGQPVGVGHASASATQTPVLQRIGAVAGHMTEAHWLILDTHWPPTAHRTGRACRKRSDWNHCGTTDLRTRNGRRAKGNVGNDTAIRAPKL